MMTRSDSMSLLASHCRRLVAVGGEEDAGDPASAQQHRRWSDATSCLPELVALQSAGHLSSLEQPEAFNAALLRFLDRLYS